MKPARLTWIDYARGIAIILVLYRHVFEGIKESGLSVEKYMYLEYANIFFFSFRMPLFFIISGIFVSASLKKRGIKNFIETKARTILYPYFLWACLQITLQIFFSKYTNGHSTPQNYLYLLYLPRQVDQFWYLYALFNVAVLYVIVKEKLKTKAVQNIVLGVLVFYISDFAHQKTLDLGFVGDILHYYLFFAIGDAISRYMSDRNNFKYFESWKSLLLLLLPFIMAQVYFLKVNIGNSNIEKYEYVEYFQPIMYVLIALTGCAFIINLTFVLQKLKLKILVWLPELGRHSLYIYVAHVIVFASVRVLLRKVFGINDVPLLMIACIAMGLIVPVMLYKLAVKLNMRWLFTLEEENTSSLKTVSYAKPLSMKTMKGGN
jgi:fucose 4-O-acetylase-like acetyltransferase